VQHSSGYTVFFAAALCVVCSVVVSSTAVGLRERQERNKLVDQRKKVLAVVGLLDEERALSDTEVMRLFDERLEPRIVTLATGEYADGVDPATFDQRRAAQDPETSAPAPDNRARVRRLPDLARVFLLREEGEVAALVLPVEGMGLWSTLYGYIALEHDARTIRGLIFYEHGETAGLGGEVDNPRWQALWPGRLAFDEQGEPRIHVIKGAAGPPGEAPYEVDGLSGATLTCNGVTNLLQFWLGEAGFGPFLERYRSGEGAE